jgi:NADH:ubiquinone oxidoreductase subunit 6 (subunit J)
MQLDESNEPMRCTLLGAKTLSIFQLIVLGIPAVVLTLLSIIVCPCVVLGCGTTNRERGEYAVVGGIRFTFHPTGVCTSLVITSKVSRNLCPLPSTSVVNFISFWGSFLSSLFLFPFTCLGLLIISAVYCFVAGLKFLVKIVKRSRSDSSDVDVTVPSTVVADDFIRDILDRMEEGRSSIAG